MAKRNSLPRGASNGKVGRSRNFERMQSPTPDYRALAGQFIRISVLNP